MDLFSRADRAGDAALLAGLVVGDERAAAAFVRRFQSPVFGLAVSVTGDEWLAQDVAQEVFVKAWRAAPTFDPRRASVLTWLLAITRNAAIDAMRSRRPTPTDSEHLDFLLSATLRSIGPEEDAVASSQRDLVLQALGSMPPEQARAVILAVIGGRTSAEISRHEGVPLGTAKTRIRTGLHRIRAALEVADD